MAEPGSEPSGKAGDLKSPARQNLILGVLFIVAILVIGAWQITKRLSLEHQMVAAAPDTVALNPAFAHLADAMGPGLYASHCASCHGADMKGAPGKNAPNLIDKAWMYDRGEVSDIERMILWGARSGVGKSRNITDMPPVGRMKILTPEEITQVVEYVVQLSGRPANPALAQLGHALFQNKGNCYDCHSSDGRGNPDYGSTDFTAGVYLWGGDRASLFRTVRDGRHGLMPAYFQQLNPAQIRALSIYIYRRSHPPHG